MGLFSKKIESYLGVDIGAGSVKVVECRNDRKRARLSTYGFAEMETGSTNPASNLGSDLDGIAATLKEVCVKAKTESKRAVTSLPIAAVFSSIISLPAMPKKELPAAVQWEAKKLVPLPIEEMILDWKPLGEPSEPSVPSPGAKAGARDPDRAPKTIRVLLTGAPKGLVQQYLTVFKRAGLELASLETEAFALIRSLVGDDPSVILILDIGFARTSMVIVDAATPMLSRSVDVGGQHFSRAIAETMGTDPEAAEQFKLDLAVMPTTGAGGGLPVILPRTLAPVIQEVRYGVNLYLSQEEHRGRVVEKVILAGGSALLPGLTDALASELNLRVFVGDPWARVIYPPDLRPALDTIGPRFAVAVGLAMREIA
jgi:type IV pilus assembly protein PilM